MKPFIVGIAGGSASGKSSFASKLEASLAGLEIQVLHMDAYFKPKEARPFSPAPFTGISYTDDNHPETIDYAALLADAKKARDSSCDIVIVEGLFALWYDELRALLDFKLYIDCRPEERIVRRLRRNMGWGLTFDEISNVYLDMVRYRHDEFVEPTRWHADLVINGSSQPEKGLETVALYIKTQCAARAQL